MVNSEALLRAEDGVNASIVRTAVTEYAKLLTQRDDAAAKWQASREINGKKITVEELAYYESAATVLGAKRIIEVMCDAIGANMQDAIRWAHEIRQRN